MFFCRCGGNGENSDSSELPVDMKDAVTLTADFSKIVDPAASEKNSHV